VVVEVLRTNPVKWGYCRACHARIEWVTTVAKHKRLPVDWPLIALDVHERNDGTRVVAIDVKQSHFVTCPNADQFRKTPKPRAVSQGR
jgi:hypothetical protein